MAGIVVLGRADWAGEGHAIISCVLPILDCATTIFDLF
jgi:hypothetical protein